MADKKISALTGAATPLDGTEVLPIVQSGATVKVANNDLRPKQIQSNATSGVLQVAGPAAAATRVMTTPDANFTAARTDAAQTFNAVSSTNLFNGTGTEIVGFSKSAGARMYLRIASNVDESLTFVQSGGGAVLKIGSNYDVTVNSGNLVQGTAAKGINFTANSPAAGMTSQLLNWYEEGTFTAVANVLGSGTITLNTNTCYYTRIGRQVTVTGAISVLSVSSPTGDTQIAGFPFTAGRPSAVALQGTGFAATASTALVARLDASTTGFYVFHFAVGTSSGSAADFQAGSSLNFSCTYFI